MGRLTEKILKEEAEKYFLRINASFSAVDDYLRPETVTIRVLPGYPEWKESRKGNPIPAYGGSKSAGWAMQSYISEALGLARYLIINDYPQEAVLGMLPRDFARHLSKRLGENSPEKNTSSSG